MLLLSVTKTTFFKLCITLNAMISYDPTFSLSVLYILLEEKETLF